MKIKFIPFAPSQNNELLPPIAAIKMLPDWYKSASPFTNNDKKPRLFPNATKNITVKWCNPFGDALGSGYFILLENDVQVTPGETSPEFVWSRGGDGFISTHSKDQISSDLIPNGYSDQPFKFTNSWGIETPPGYSALFTHPMNRADLPFLTLSGVVDTDAYHQPINFPFIIRDDFEGIIEAGTPIAQVLPFKREPWQSEQEDFDLERIGSISSGFYRKILRPYKRGYWKKKTYK